MKIIYHQFGGLSRKISSLQGQVSRVGEGTDALTIKSAKSAAQGQVSRVGEGTDHYRLAKNVRKP